MLAPITEEWFVGFVDGEGCFTIRVDRPTGGVNAGSRQAHIRLEVNQALRDAPIIERIHEFFGFGRVDHNTGGGRLCQWRVLRQQDLEAMVGLFDRVPLRTLKRHDYAIWRRAVLAKARFLTGPAAHNGTNEKVWDELDALAGEMRLLRRSRRSSLAA